MTVRPALLAAAALAAALGIWLALSRWGAGGSGDLGALAQGLRRDDEPDSHFELGWRHHAARRVLANEVVAGRMSLPEAAGHFRRLDEADPGFPRPSADERALCHRVLDLAWEVIWHQQRYAAAARWCAEAFTAHPDLLAGPPRTDVPPGGRRPLCPRAG
jgi:hypothetical protein